MELKHRDDVPRKSSLRATGVPDLQQPAAGGRRYPTRYSIRSIILRMENVVEEEVAAKARTENGVRPGRSIGTAIFEAEASGILNWALVGLARLRARVLPAATDSVRDAVSVSRTTTTPSRSGSGKPSSSTPIRWSSAAIWSDLSMAGSSSRKARRPKAAAADGCCPSCGTRFPGSANSRTIHFDTSLA